MDEKKRMTWEEIKQKYPSQYVGLIEVQKDPVNKLTGIVYCTSKDTDINEMHFMASRGEISLEYTALDECELLGALTL